MKARIVIAIMVPVLLVGCSRNLQTPTQPGPTLSGSPSVREHPADPVPPEMHPEAPRRQRGTDGLASMPSTISLAEFARKYEGAGEPRVAILFNRQFGSQLTSWTMDSKEVFQDVRSVQVAGAEETDFDARVGSGTISGGSRTSRSGEGVEVTRSESFREYERAAERHGFSTEYVEWKFHEGFMAPFSSAGVRLVDPDLIMQATARDGDVDEAGRRVSDINVNLGALKEKADWVVEVLMVPDGRAATGYLFRANVRVLESGEILASSMSNLDEFRERPVRRKIIAAPGGYRIEEEELPGPTLEEYAEDLAVRLLSDLSRKL